MLQEAVKLDGQKFSFHQIESPQEVEELASAMAASDPWLRLGISVDVCRRRLADPGLERWGVTVDGQPAGFVLLQMQGAFTGYIVSIMIMEAFRGQGVGSALLAFAEEQVFARTPNMFLCVSGFNHSAREFYSRRGYDTIGVLKDYLVTGEDEILMRKTIGPLRRNLPKEG